MVKLKKHIYIISLFIITVISCENLEEDYNMPQYNNPVKIGVVGDVSILREQVENIFFGANLAREEINHNDGLIINNIPSEIELIFKNSAGSAEEGIQVTQELIDGGVQLIIGPTFSSVAIEMAELCIENNILMMTYSATTPELSLINDNDLIWRTCSSDYTFGTISAQYAFDTLQSRKAAILYRDDRYGQGLSEIIKNNFTKLGGYISGYIPFPGDIDLTTYDFEYELNTLLKEEVDIIYVIAFNSEISLLANKIYNTPEYQAFSIKPYIFVNDGILPEEIIVNVNPDLLNTIIGITSTNEDNTNYDTYKTNYISRYKFPPATYSEHAYDAIYCLAYAMIRANSTSPEGIKNYLREISGIGTSEINNPAEQIKIGVNEYNLGKSILLRGGSINYEGASGPINFDEFGDPIPKIVLWGIKNNEYVEITHYEK